jgi:hypothetical protein
VKITEGDGNVFIGVVFAIAVTNSLVDITSNASCSGNAFRDCWFYGSAGTGVLIKNKGYGTVFDNPSVGNHSGDIWSTDNQIKITNPLAFPVAGKKLIVHTISQYHATMHVSLELLVRGGSTAGRPDGTTIDAVVEYFNYDTSEREIWDPISAVWRPTVGVPAGAVIPTHKLTDQTAKTTGYTLAVADSGTRLPCSSGTPFTITVPSAATLGNGFSAEVINIGSGAIAVNGPSASDLSLAQHESCYIFVTGGVLYGAKGAYTAL